MGKVILTTKVTTKKSTSEVTFKNTNELLGFLARTGGKVNKDKTITVS